MGGDGKREEKGRVDLAGGARFGTEGKGSVSVSLLSSPLLSSRWGKRGGKRDTAARAVPTVLTISKERREGGGKEKRSEGTREVGGERRENEKGGGRGREAG